MAISEKKREYHRVYRVANKKAVKATKRRYYEAHREEAMREAAPVVDHCHKTGFIRGLPCAPCNAALGMTYDNPETLRRMADYIEKANVVTDILL